jgi:hypothetical protein
MHCFAMTKPLCSELADIEWLTGAEAGAILAELAEDTRPLHLVAARLRASLSAQRTHLLLEQAELRRRAAAKFAHPERMFFTRVGLEQATDEWVATYKASRFIEPRAGSVSDRGSLPPAYTKSESEGCVTDVADLCCGIGGDLIAFARGATAVGVERDPAVAHFASVNSGIAVQAIDVADYDVRAADAWHIDPDRRPGGRRTTSLDWCEPNRESIECLLNCAPNAAIKLAPATDVPDEWAKRCELEWISRDRECKQLVAWHGDLAATPSQHRATILASSASRGVAICETVHRTIVGLANQSIPIATEVLEYVFDVDPAVTAARLTGTLAGEHGLLALGGGPTYLTGTHFINEAALAGFRVDDILPMRVAKLAQQLRAHNIGQLEIKKRGIDIDPEKLRRELKLRGSSAATLLITKMGGRPMAILAERIVL